MAIVPSTCRYKRPPRRKKAVALAVPEIVAIPRKRGRKVILPVAQRQEPEEEPHRERLVAGGGLRPVRS